MNPEDYMKMALKEAEKAFRADEVPVGAVIVDPVGGVVVAKAHNLGEHGKDAAAHAELEAMRRAWTCTLRWNPVRCVRRRLR